jgi:hypothetical protein
LALEGGSRTDVRFCPVTVAKPMPWASQRVIGFAGRRTARSAPNADSELWRGPGCSPYRRLISPSSAQATLSGVGAGHGGHSAYVTFASDARRRAEQDLAHAERAVRETKTSSLDASRLRKVQRRIADVERQLAFMKEGERGVDQLSSWLHASESLKAASLLTSLRRRTYVKKLERQEIRELSRRTKNCGAPSTAHKGPTELADHRNVAWPGADHSARRWTQGAIAAGQHRSADLAPWARTTGCDPGQAESSSIPPTLRCLFSTMRHKRLIQINSSV